MNKIWLIIKREYWTRVRKKSFIITTLLAPVGFALFFVAVIFISSYGESKKRIVVLDESGLFEDHGLRNDDESSMYYFFFEEGTQEEWEEIYQDEEHLYDGILVIPPIKYLDRPPKVTYRSDQPLGLRAKDFIQDELRRVLHEIKYKQENIDSKKLAEINKIKIDIKSETIGEDQGNINPMIGAGFGYIMGLAIYVILLIYGNMVMKGVVEEKTNRIVEIIISSVKPFQLMLGKIIGIGAVGLTQSVLWFILIIITQFGLGLVFSSSIAEMQDMANQPGMGGADQEETARMIAGFMKDIGDINFTAIIFNFIFYFVGGYMLYGGLFAAMGASTSDDGDVQSLNFVVSLPIIISIIIMISTIQEPNSSLAVWGSIIPFTAPVVMMARIAFDPPLWQILLSYAMLIIGFMGTTWLAAKIYRVGILTYGKKVSIKDIWKWIRYY